MQAAPRRHHRVPWEDQELDLALRLPSTVNRPKIQKGSGANPRAPANEIGVPLKYFLVPTVFSQAARKFFCKKFQRRCSAIVALDQTQRQGRCPLFPESFIAHELCTASIRLYANS
jgi:hypothetical protein